MQYRSLLGIAVLAAGLTGCNTKPGATHEPVAFEQVKDPPLTANTHFAAGQLAESRGMLDTAAEQYRLALRMDPREANSMYRLGVVYAELHRFPEAVETWNKYIKLTNGSADAYNNLALCEELAGNPAGAESDYKRGIAHDPQNESCRVNYGLMLARHGRVNESILQFQAVLPPAQVHYNLASVYELQHRKEQARLEYQKALQLDPNFTDARQKLASLN